MYSEREENPSGRFMSAITQIPEKAPRNAALCAFTNIEIIQADIAELPLPGTCADVDGSINLSPQKLCVLEEGFHVLEPGGRLYIADMVRDTLTEDSSCGCEQFRRLVGQLRRRNTRLGVLPATVGRSGFTDAEMVGTTGYRTSPETIGALFRARKPIPLMQLSPRQATPIDCR